MTPLQSRPRVVTAAFWCWVVASILLIVGGLIAASVSALPMVYRGGGVITALAGAAMAFLAGRTRGGDVRFRRAALALSLTIVVLVALLAVFGVVHVLTLLAVIPLIAGTVLSPDRPHRRPCRRRSDTHRPAARGALLRAGRQLVVAGGRPRSGGRHDADSDICWLRHTAAGPRHFLRSGERLPRDSGDARPSAAGYGTRPHRRDRADLPRAEGPRRAEVAVGARTRRAHRRTAGTHRHRPQADQRSRRSGVGAQAPATAGRADPRGGRAHTAGTGVMRARVELVLAVIATVGCVLSWLAASSTVTVAPVLDGEPQTTSVVYSPPLLVLSLFLATVAGVLVVVGIARLRRS